MTYDVAIVGASIAGSTAAYLLGRHGVKVALIDKANFPRRKPCGEGLSRAGGAILERIGLSDTLATVPHLQFRGYRLSTQHQSAILATPHSGGVTIQRERFDFALLQAALSHTNVVPILNQHVTSLDPSGTIRFKTGELKARHLIVASGANSSILRALNLAETTYGPRRIGSTATFAGSFEAVPDLVHIKILSDYEIYATPLPGHQLNVNILGPYPPTQNIRSQLYDPRTLEQIARPLGFFGQMSLPPLGRAPIGNRSRQATLGATFLIGDAAEEFDPIGGMGMTHALRSAELVAQALIAHIDGQATLAQVMTDYERQRRISAKSMRLFTKLCYHTLRSSPYVPGLLRVATSPLGRIITDHFSYDGA